VAALIDQERQRAILTQPGARHTQYYLTLTWVPPVAAVQQGLRYFLTGQQSRSQDVQSVSLQEFVEQADYVMDLLQGMLAVGRPLTTPEMLTYLHSCVSDRWHPIGFPAQVLDIDTQLCDTPYVGGWEPCLGSWHLRPVSVLGYPATSTVGVLKALDAAELDYRWSVRWTALERHLQEGLLQRTQKEWHGQQKTLIQRFFERVTFQETEILNEDALNKAGESSTARQELGADIVAYGDFGTTVIVWDTNPKVVDDKRQVVMQAFEAQGFTCVAERMHATAAWLSTHPGNRLDSVRRTPQHSLTLAHLCPGLTAMWSGVTWDTHLNGPPWFVAQTTGNTLFSVVNHVNDLGHTLVLGPTRSGKSTLLAFTASQWLRYPGAQIFWFDLDGSARLPTLLLGGCWYDLGAGNIAFQPLRDIHDPTERGWALGWILDLLKEAAVPITGEAQAYVASTLRRLAEEPPHLRTIQQLLTIMAAQTRQTDLKAQSGHIDSAGIAHPDHRLQSLVAMHHSVRQALRPYSRDGEYGWLLDSDRDDIQENTLQVFEQRALLTMPRLVGATSRYIFHRLEQRFSTDHPTLLLMDDAAVTWAMPDFEQRGKRWLMTTAKKSVSLVFATHSLAQVFESPLGPLLLEGCPTRFFLPSPGARAPQMAAIYRKLGLTDPEIQTIATMRQQRDVYYSCESLGKRPFSLALSPFILACLARNTAEDHALMDALLAREGREGFPQAWLRAQGYATEAQLASGGGMAPLQEVLAAEQSRCYRENAGNGSQESVGKRKHSSRGVYSVIKE
jgi:type IV secretion system protein VirB4